MKKYRKEWLKYAKFAMSRLGYVPGKDESWDLLLLWQYLQERARTCKPATVVSGLSKLAHQSVRHGHILPVAKYEQPTLMRKQIKRMIRQLQLDYSNSDRSRPCGSSTPLGAESVTALITMLGAGSERGFKTLSRAARHHLVACLMQHSGAMRFGHFVFRRYKVSDLQWLADGSARLSTDWQRYPGQQEQVIAFLAFPQWKAQKYLVQDARTRVQTLTAAKMLAWHVQDMEAEDLLFEPVRGRKADRGDRQRWLRAALRAAWPQRPEHVDQAIGKVTPHAFRGGLAVGLRTEGASFEQIARAGRWRSRRAVKLYASRVTLAARWSAPLVRVVSRNARRTLSALSVRRCQANRTR